MNKFTVTIQHKDQILTREVQKDSFTVGRSLDCDISLNDALVSRVHLVVNRRWNQIWIEDKNSSNGTYLNNTKIVQGSPVNVVSQDKIRLGRSEYYVSIELETEVVEATQALDAPVEEEAPIEDTVMMPPPSDPTFLAEKTLHEAKRRAAQIILEGETQAEKRVQSIYLKAREAQSHAEAFYQSRMGEAHKEADAILSDYQKQGQTLVHEARTMAQELREEVDIYVLNLKEKARKDAEDLVTEATLQVEKMKSEALDAAKAQGEKEAEILIKNSRDEADRILDFARLQSQELRERIENDTAAVKKLSEEISSREQSLKGMDEEVQFLLKEKQECQDYVSQENAALDERRESEVLNLKNLFQSENDRLKGLYDSEEKKWNNLVTKETEDLKKLQEQVKGLGEKNKSLEKSVQELMEKQAHLSMDIREIDGKKSQLLKEYESQKIFLAETLAKEKTQIMKSEEERLEEMRLEMSQRLRKMEGDLLEDVLRKKSMMIKEIHAAIEKEVVKFMDVEKWGQISPVVEAQIQDAIEGRVASLSQSNAILQQPTDLLKKRKQEKWRWAAMGLAAGAVIYFISQKTVSTVTKDQSPMQSAMASEAQKRKEDLERRRFNPEQTAELRDNYTDSVIYTRNFIDVYLDEQFQQRLYKASSQYLLKTWRVDEDSSIQVLAVATTLVKELQASREKIHPDFVKEGIAKMRALESESLARMKLILGTQVRLESYRRFEMSFYREEMQKRQMAQHY